MCLQTYARDVRKYVPGQVQAKAIASCLKQEAVQLPRLQPVCLGQKHQHTGSSLAPAWLTRPEMTTSGYLEQARLAGWLAAGKRYLYGESVTVTEV